MVKDDLTLQIVHLALLQPIVSQMLTSGHTLSECNCASPPTA